MTYELNYHALVEPKPARPQFPHEVYLVRQAGRNDESCSPAQAQARLLDACNAHPLTSEWTIRGNIITITIEKTKAGSTPAADRARGA